MLDREWTDQVDRSKWGAGPWDSEPQDKTQWTDEETGLPCLTLRNSMGAWCGYVGVDASHPLHGVDDSDVPYEDEGPHDVHGGLTYAEACTGDPEGHSICHVTEEGEPEVWWFGFDTAHHGDVTPGSRMVRYHHTEVYRTLHYVKRECALLARRLKAQP